MTQKARLSLKLLLPSVPDSGDSCVKRLADLLRAKEGIDMAHLVSGGRSDSTALCIHYAPERLTLAAVRELAQRAGMTLEARYGHLVVSTGAMSAARARTLEARLLETPGILETAVSPTGMIRVEYDREQTTGAAVQAALARIGAGHEGSGDKSAAEANRAAAPEDASEQEHEHDHECPFGEWTELLSAGVAGVFLLIGWLLSLTSLTSWIS